MRLNALHSVFPALLDSGISIELISPPGLGKSEFVHDQVKRMSERTGQKWGFAKLFLATMTPADLLGYMVPVVEGGLAKSKFTMPTWMQTEDGGVVTDYPRGILFLDEFGQGEADVKRASAELLLNGQLGPWKLPKGWSVIAASNRSTDRSGVTKSFDFVINRRTQIEIQPDLSSWIDWAIGAKIDPLVIAFAEKNPAVVFNGEVPKVQGPWCTPRSLVMMAKMLDHMRTTDGDVRGPFPTDDNAIEVASGMIGSPAAAQMMAFIKTSLDVPTFEAIMADPAGTFVPDAPDARMIVAYQLASRGKKEHVPAMCTYIKRFPPEFMTSWARAMVKWNATNCTVPEFMKLYSENATLFKMIIVGR